MLITGISERDNMSQSTSPGFLRIWPDYVMVLTQENIVTVFNNNNGNHNLTVNSWAGALKVPATAKGVILNMSCIINAKGVAGTVNSSVVTFYNANTFALADVADQMQVQAYEWSVVAANTALLQVTSKIFAPIVNGNIYYSVSGTNAAQNFDPFLGGYWDR